MVPWAGKRTSEGGLGPGRVRGAWAMRKFGTWEQSGILSSKDNHLLHQHKPSVSLYIIVRY